MNDTVKEQQATPTNPLQKPQLPFRIVTEYTNIKTVGFLDKLAGLAQFYDRKLINGDITRDEAGLGKYNDDMNEEALRQQEMANNMFSQQQEMASNLRPFAGVNPNQATNLDTQANSNFNKSLPTKSNSSSEDRAL